MEERHIMDSMVKFEKGHKRYAILSIILSFTFNTAKLLKYQNISELNYMNYKQYLPTKDNHLICFLALTTSLNHIYNGNKSAKWNYNTSTSIFHI